MERVEFPRLMTQEEINRETRKHRLTMGMIAIQPILLILLTMVAMGLALNLVQIIQAISR